MQLNNVFNRVREKKMDALLLKHKRLAEKKPARTKIPAAVAFLVFGWFLLFLLPLARAWTDEPQSIKVFRNSPQWHSLLQNVEDVKPTEEAGGPNQSRRPNQAKWGIPMLKVCRSQPDLATEKRWIACLNVRKIDWKNQMVIIYAEGATQGRGDSVEQVQLTTFQVNSGVLEVGVKIGPLRECYSSPCAIALVEKFDGPVRCKGITAK